ncbi:MAG: hypothetical protein HFJ25_01895 [Clostridia bacterium]|nr:hypothetical protein [Clostridia bacterium]
MAFFTEKEDSTNGKIIKTGDNVIIKATNEKGFVISILDNQYMVSSNGNVENYFRDEIEWID